jgi:hypothetical protein
MNDQLVDVRTPLAVSRNARVEIGRDGVLHVLAGPVTLHLERAACEELTTTLARAMVVLAQLEPKQLHPTLALVRGEVSEPSSTASREARHVP